MSFVAVAIGTGVAGITGAVINSNAVGGAAQTQANATNNATALQSQMYAQQQADAAPYRQAGVSALSQMQDPSFQQTFNASDMEQNDPGYAFRLQQGQQALERSAAASGGLQSGGTLKGIANYAQNYASNEYNNAFNQFQSSQNQRFNQLASIAGLGQTANGQVGQAGQAAANNIGTLGTANANAQGSAAIAQGNIASGTLSGLSNGLGKNWMTYSMMNNSSLPSNQLSTPSMTYDSSAAAAPNLGMNYQF